ncbi:hypothetical protein EV702DRAFT_1024673 [Suillus placidus]|uniref:VASt domain-containing protein n=1 Tax=Suillus placidus TaxID=48579 RepID=A0A9P7D5E5_9AGAM|nr:hypothetical protein EV702DRAFT_1024673 [Suillus placidus]
MAPSFFSKLVKPSTLSSPSGRENTTASPRQPIPERPHSQSISHPPSSLLDPASDNSSTKGSVKIGIIPPSPRSALSAFPDPPSQDNNPPSDTSQHRRARSQDRMVQDRHAVSFAARPMASDSSLSTDDMLPTPTPSRSRIEEWKKSSADSSPKSSHQLTPASSTGNLKAFVDKRSSTHPSNAHKVVNKTPSKQSLRNRTQPPAPLDFDHPESNARSDTHRRTGRHEHNAVIIENGLVDSPTALSHAQKSSHHQQELLPTLTDADAKSIHSVNSSASKQKKGWRRPSLTTPTRKHSGIASAIVASGLTMANTQMSPVPPVSNSVSKKVTSGTVRSNGSAYSAVRHAASASVTSMPSSVDASARTRHVLSSRDDFSDGQTDTFASSGESEGSDDELDINEDIPVTGFAVASSKRNADFHELFPSIPEGDYLIEDYGCALQREILIQGRIYISENHICFHANIFGWITDLSIPIYEITALEKKMTAFVIPNAIQITTRQAKYTFASFLSRDTTYDVIANIWRLARPDDAFTESQTGSSGNIVSPASTSDVSGPVVTSGGKDAAPVTRINKVTHCVCSKNGQHLNEIALETVLPGTPDKIYNLMFASGFIKDFMRVDQKLMDVQISDWSPTGDHLKLLARNMSYIKPLNNSVGPKQTKCEIHDETLTCDFDDHVVMLTTTKTPDVPSGGVFSVKTKTCLMWASAISTRVIVSTQVDWTGRSFIKGLIEKSAIDGQKVYHSDLDKAMRMYIQEHQSEFIPAGIDPTAVAPIEPLSPLIEFTDPTLLGRSLGISDEAARKAREHERNRRGLQWAYETFDGAYGVAKRSTFGALELVKEAWEQSSAMTILYFVIVILVFSNLWTLMLVGQREEAGRRKEAKRAEEREKWAQDVVTGLWEEMAIGRARGGGIGSSGIFGVGGGGSVHSGHVGGDWRSEVDAITTTLNAVEERVRLLRESLDALN